MPKKHRKPKTHKNTPAKPAPSAQARPFAFTVFPTLYADTMDPQGGPFDAFCAILAESPPEAPAKAALPLFCPMLFDGTKSPKGAMRWDKGVTDICGACGDHDAGTISPEAARDRLREAGIEGFIYTSPRHTKDKPRWRSVTPFAGSTRDHNAHRAAVERLNHLFDGQLTSESFTLSQSYYFGRVTGAEYVTYTVAGSRRIDEATDIERLAQVQAVPAMKGNGNAPGGSMDFWVDQIVTGADLHNAARGLTASLIAKGMAAQDVRATVGVLASRSGREPARIAALLEGELDRMIDGAVEKGYAPVDGTDILRQALKATGLAPSADTPSPAWAKRISEWKPRTLAEIKTPPAPPSYYVDGLIQAQRVIGLISQGGMAKTTLILLLAICTATGRPWLGRAVKQGSFALLSLDDAQEELDAALTLLGDAMRLTDAEWEMVRQHVRLISLLDEDATIAFAARAGAGIEPTHIEAFVIRALEGVPSFRCVAFDTQRQFAGEDTNLTQVMTIATKAVTRVARARKCAAIIPHHGTKEGSRTGVTDMYAAAGSGAFSDNLRVVLVLTEATREDVEAALKTDARSGVELAMAEKIIRMTDTRGSLLRRAEGDSYIARSGYRFAPITGERKSAEERDHDRTLKILRAVAGGAVTKNAILKAAGGKRADTFKLIDALLAGRKLLSRSAEGKPIKLTEDGVRAIGGPETGAAVPTTGTA